MNVILDLRKTSGLTQRRIAELAGTSQPTIAAYENGRKSPTLDTVERIATSVGLSLNWKVGRIPTREELRSIAYHEALRPILMKDEKSVRRKARENIRRMKSVHPHAGRLLNLWRAWLDLPISTLCDLMVEQSELAADMRQVSPFSGILSASKRREIIQSLSDT